MKPANVTTFTEKYFHEEICRFRQAFGDKTWWAKSEEQRNAWIGGLFYVYLNIVNDDGSLPNHEQIDKWATTFDATLDEYNRRLVMLPIRRALGPVCHNPQTTKPYSPFDDSQEEHESFA